MSAVNSENNCVNASDLGATNITDCVCIDEQTATCSSRRNGKLAIKVVIGPRLLRNKNEQEWATFTAAQLLSVCLGNVATNLFREWSSSAEYDTIFIYEFTIIIRPTYRKITSDA